LFVAKLIRIFEISDSVACLKVEKLRGVLIAQMSEDIRRSGESTKR